ncbi:MAG: alpha/beta hydrolase [Chloroflexota bacterium]|jgi:pimeloyl-ACP methyl ester carboxylesterase|nr:alpha/beta hydrolase [Chloroflexota bacterium]MDP6757953.1 alpha/beta hydrolase [Chloroflexota bacterium]
MTAHRRSYREGYIPLENVGLHYLEWGDNGPHVLVLHGATSMAVNHAWFIEELFPNCHVWAPDHRGHGQSSRADSYDIDEFADDTAQFIDAMGIKNPLVLGHSLGGAISMCLFGRGEIPTSKLLLKDIGPEMPHRDHPRAEDRPLAWDSYDAAFADLKDSPTALGDPAAFIANNLRWTDNGALAVRFDPAFSTVLRSPRNLWEGLPRITAPTLIPHGEHSNVLSAEMAARMVEVMPDARVVEFPGCSHLLEWEESERFVEIMREFVGDEFA